jgi:hypothetical protein
MMEHFSGTTFQNPLDYQKVFKNNRVAIAKLELTRNASLCSVEITQPRPWRFDVLTGCVTHARESRFSLSPHACPPARASRNIKANQSAWVRGWRLPKVRAASCGLRVYC